MKKCGKNPNIGYGARIHKNTELGDFSGVGRNCEIMNGVTIGSEVLLGPDVYICTEKHNFENPDIAIRLQGMCDRKAVIIEDNVWIGARAIILPGVTIGTGSVIGAGSVVTKDIPPMVVAAGNPAKVVKLRRKV